MTQKKQVTIEIKTAGQHFATYALVRDKRTGRKLHETDVVPYQFNNAACRLAESWIREKGYELNDDE